MRIKHLLVIVVLTAFCEALVFCPASAEAARMKIEKRNYSLLWKSFLRKDSDRAPEMIYPYDDCFRAVAKLYNLPLPLLLAVARGESDFNPTARSSANCYGVMQIQWPGTAEELGIHTFKELYNPCHNIRAGARYLRQLLDRYNGDIHITLAAYNYGPTRIRKGTRASGLPQGAVWYSGYIYHHLEQVLAGSGSSGKIPGQRILYNPANKLPIIIFHTPFRARGFMAYFKEEAPELRLDWFKTSLGESYVVMMFNDKKEKARGIMMMKKLGYAVDPKKGFN